MAPGQAGLTPIEQSKAGNRLLEHLLDSGMLQPTEGQHVLELSLSRGEPLPRLLSRLGIVSEIALASALAELHGTTVLSDGEIPDQAITGRDFSTKFLIGSEILPLYETETEIVVAMADPGDKYAADSVRMLCDKPVRIVAAQRSSILSTIGRLYGPHQQTLSPAPKARGAHRWRDRVETSPVAKRVNELLTRAVSDRASDVHFEQGLDATRVRFRIDGVMHDVESFDPEVGPRACARVKLISNLDVAERRLPQDGRFQFDTDGEEIDIRVSSMPVSDGESVVMRILHRSHTQVELENLGFDPAVTASIQNCLRGAGLLLVTGPTGSGKSTTLYSALAKLNTESRKLVTVEDPVEYDLGGVNQIQVKPDLQLTFASALRSVLRQDPDIIMVGEVRDAETAEITIQAALTGHLVLTTLHTKDASSCFLRLSDMGVEPYLLASTVTGALAQRLVRRLCPDCRQEREPDSLTRDWFSAAGAAPAGTVVFEAVGCDRCAGTGYRGRTAVGEFIVVDDAVSQLIRSNAGSDLIHKTARRNGTVPLIQDAARRVRMGETTVDEVIRCLG